MKVCNHCLKEKDENEFNWRYKALGVRNKTCKDCQPVFNKIYYEGDAKKKHLKQVKERTAVAREAAREHVYEYLLHHPSELCGEADPRVLEFHHVSEKDMAIINKYTSHKNWMAFLKLACVDILLQRIFG